MAKTLVSRQQPRGDAIQERTQESMAKAVAEGKAPRAIGLKRLTNADAAGEIHLLQIERTNARCTGCHKAWRLHAASVSPKADTIVTGLNSEGS